MAAPRIHLASAALLLAAVQGCGDEQRDPEVTARPTHTPSASAVPSSIAVLRFGDNGVDVSLDVGATASVMLPGESYSWGEPEVSGDAVTISEVVSDAPASSRSWAVTARRPGTGRITLTGSPTCRSATPSCAAPDVVWTARFTVN